MTGKKKTASRAGKERSARSYAHPEASALLRPDVGAQAQFRRKKPPTTYRHDPSLSPALDWAGKAERLSFDVPTLPLFVHERLSTAAILETLKGHTRDRQVDMFDLFGESDLPIRDRLLKAYEHRNGWVNRLILGDSLVVMNSLLGYEGLGGQVQTLYMDPPYAVKFGSNFQPFVRRRDVTHGADEHMVREPEMVQAYRDTWELGVHSFLTYLRDRLLLARELLHPSGSIFVQMSDTNLHHVREVMDEVFGAECFVSQISFQTTSDFATRTLATLGDFLLWYARDPEQLKVRKLFEEQPVVLGEGNARWVLLPDGSYRGVAAAERRRERPLPEGARLYKPGDLQSQGAAREPQPFEFEGKVYTPGANSHWKSGYPEGLDRLAAAGRIHVAANSLRYRRFASDFPYKERSNLWTDTLTGSFTNEKMYVVQTNPKVVERCLLMTTDPGDLVLDPTCGSGTTAYCAEKWGRRWITTDTSRVPLALARQRLLTSRFAFYRLKEPDRGPAGGFEYRRRQNAKGEEVGGIVPHLTLESIANDEPAKEEVLVDRPEEDVGVTRVSGPFCVEATIPTPVDWEGDGGEDSGDVSAAGAYANHVERMIEVLRRSPVLHLGGGRTVRLSRVRPPARTLNLSAEALIEGEGNGRQTPAGAGSPAPADLSVHAPRPSRPASPAAPAGASNADRRGAPAGDAQAGARAGAAAIVFGPENGAVSETLVFEAAREAYAKGYGHLYVIGFAIQPNARGLVEDCEQAVGVPATYVQASMDLIMGDLLKNLRSSQVFSVCGLPDVRIRRAARSALGGLPAAPVARARAQAGAQSYQVELLGLDVFDPVAMDSDHREGSDVPAWFLDTDYNGLCFHVCQAFFPRTSAWEALKQSLRGEFEDSVWAHLSGTVSAPFQAGGHGHVAVKVVDDRGNELMVVKPLSEAEREETA